MDRLDPLLLFEAAEKFEKASPQPDVVQDERTDAVVKVLRPGSGLGNTFYVGNGVQLERYCPALVNNNRATLIQVEQIDHWLFNLPEVLRVLRTFLSGARERPAMLWSHSLCWTDRAVQFYANNVRVDDIEYAPAECPHGEEVILRFEPKSCRQVAVRTDAVRWLRPSGVEDSSEPLLKMTKMRRNVDGRGRLVGRSYREEVGAATEGWRDDPSVARGRLPGLQGLVYGLALDRTGETRLMRLPLAPCEKIIDRTGLLDVYLLKAMRLFKRPASEDREDVMADELGFAFDAQGLMAYIVASCQRYEGWADESRWGGHLLDWVGQNIPRGKLR